MLSLLRRIFRKYSKMMPLTPFFRRFRYIPYSVYTKMPRISGASQAVEKPLSLIKKGCRTLLALLVLHRAKLLASNQSVLALGVAPSGVRAAAPHSAPARMPGVYAQRLCTMQSQQSIHSPSPWGRGLGFRQGCRDRTPKGFAGRKAHKAFL